MWGFHNGTPGCWSRVYWTKGWNTVTGSTSSRLAPNGRTSAGRDVFQGADVHR